MLTGLRVIELATYIAAPAAAGMLADWGADVIKVEPPTGCPMRLMFSSLQNDFYQGNPVFGLDNRGKRGIVLDVSKEDGMEALKRLVKDADVFITNLRPDSMKSLAVEYDDLKAVNPRLVYASLTGYGLQGEEKNRAGLDIAAFYARSGFGHLSTIKGGEPVLMRTAVGDHITGVGMVAGIMAALLEREKTGRGKFVEASLLRAGVYAAGSDMSIQLKFNRVGSLKARHDSVNPLSNFFKTKEGSWFVIVPRQGEKDWPALCRAIGKPELIDDERFNGNRARRNNAAELVDMLDAEFAAHDMNEWKQKLDAEDIVWAPMQSPAQVAEDPQAIAAGAFVEMTDQNSNETYLSPAPPVRFPEEGDTPKRGAPELGQHTEQVLKEIGYDNKTITELKTSGALG